ncbi:hypothetical protein AYK26_07760 [Euryarchaeota archaeon SM23-78]|nr:MAG: hypothetical protein AYK26_07760 [Euryarchaeota archaeon SM23-78]
MSSITNPYTPAGEGRASEVEARVFDPKVWAVRYVEIPSNMQMRVEYSGYNALYLGYADSGLGISASGWLLQKYTYDASGRATLRQISYDSWDDRALTTYK